MLINHIKSEKNPQNSSRGVTIFKLLMIFALLGIAFWLLLFGLEKAKIIRTLQWSRSIYRLFATNARAVWDFNEGEGNIVRDSSGYDNDGILGDGTCFPGEGSCPEWTKGVIGSGLRFDGIDDYVNCGSSDSLNISGSFTIEAWVYPATFRYFGGDHDFVDIYHSDAIYIELTEFAGKLRTWTRSLSPPETISKDSLDLKAWNHIVVTWNADIKNLKFYLNGKIDKSVDKGGFFGGIAGFVNIGRHSDGGRYFKGDIDEVKIYDQALTGQVIQEHYLAGVKNHSLDLVKK